jgi:putative transposon-encoded protein
MKRKNEKARWITIFTKRKIRRFANDANVDSPNEYLCNRTHHIICDNKIWRQIRC